MPQHHDLSAPQQRLFFLDWLRICAFFLLIAYHIGMYYVSWDWHVKSPYASNAIEPLMMLSSPWRLSLLFMISGVASSFLLQKLSLSSFARQRTWTLLPPLLFGMLVIVPPQAYLEVVEKLAYQGSYLDFMRLYLQAYHGFCRGNNCLDLPTWNHLWFVSYLWVYTLLLVALLSMFGKKLPNIISALSKMLTGWQCLVWPIVVLALARVGLLSFFPAKQNLVSDWYNHAHYLPLFLLGFALAHQRLFWQQLDALRWQSLTLGILGWALLAIYYQLPEHAINAEHELYWRLAQRIVFAAVEWLAICSVCGFAHHHLQFDSSKRRYLSQAVFPVYILHQTLIVVMAHALKPAQFHPAMEALILLVLTLTLSFAGFEIVRRSALLRPLFGLRAEAGAVLRTEHAAHIRDEPRFSSN